MASSTNEGYLPASESHTAAWLGERTEESDQLMTQIGAMEAIEIFMPDPETSSTRSFLSRQRHFAIGSNVPISAEFRFSKSRDRLEL